MNETNRKVYRDEKYQKKLINRLKRIEGQVRGIIKMVENDAYCPDILVQTAAVNSAINAFNRDLVSQHLRHCVQNDLKEGNEEVIDELVVILQKMMK